MLKKIILILCFCIVSCKSNYREKARYKHLFDITGIIDFFQNNINKNNEFDVFIDYGHNCFNNLTSKIMVENNLLKIKTKTKFCNIGLKNMDTVFTISKTDFLKELNYQDKISKTRIILAGNYQNIRFKTGEEIITIFRRSRVLEGIVELLEKGKLNKKLYNKEVNFKKITISDKEGNIIKELKKINR